MAQESFDDRPGDSERRTVLNVFGLTLEVSNPRLAELLTMDAKEALGTDIKDIFGGGDRDRPFADADATALESLARPDDAKSLRDQHALHDLRDRVRRAGDRLGFTVFPDDTWSSDAGITVLVREFPRSVTLAAAAHFARQIADVLGRTEDPDRTSALLVAGERGTADVLKVAVRQARLHESIRVAFIDDLEVLSSLVAEGAASHTQALAIIAPIAAIDVGEIVAVLRAAAVHDSSGSHD